MNNFQIVTSKEKIVEVTSEFASEIQYDNFHPFVFLSNKQIVASGELKFDIESNSAEIKYVQARDKRRGYGRKFVEYLKAMPDIHLLWGESLPEAVTFWVKVGAKFYDDQYRNYLNTTETEFEDVQPFEFFIEC